MVNCAVSGCNNYYRNTKGTDIKYFRFPKDREISHKWLAACWRADKVNLRNATVCSIHFEPDSFEIPLKCQLLNYLPKTVRLLRDNAVPTLNLPGKPHKVKSSSERSLRMAKRKHKEEINNILLEEIKKNSFESTSLQENCANDKVLDVGNQAAFSPIRNTLQEDCENENIEILRKKVASLENANYELRKENQEMKQKIQEMKQQKLSPYKEVKKILSKVFTPGQIKKLMNPEIKNIHWFPQDIESAISLQSVSPKAYRYLRIKGFPLPSLSTLRRLRVERLGNRVELRD